MFIHTSENGHFEVHAVFLLQKCPPGGIPSGPALVFGDWIPTEVVPVKSAVRQGLSHLSPYPAPQTQIRRLSEG